MISQKKFIIPFVVLIFVIIYGKFLYIGYAPVHDRPSLSTYSEEDINTILGNLGVKPEECMTKYLDMGFGPFITHTDYDNIISKSNYPSNKISRIIFEIELYNIQKENLPKLNTATEKLIISEQPELFKNVKQEYHSAICFLYYYNLLLMDTNGKPNYYSKLTNYDYINIYLRLREIYLDLGILSIEPTDKVTEIFGVGYLKPQELDQDTKTEETEDKEGTKDTEVEQKEQESQEEQG